MDSGSLIVQTSLANKINLPQIGSLKSIKLLREINNAAGSPVNLTNKR
jgi:hypothetical protein